jgi:hypothetical protein
MHPGMRHFIIAILLALVLPAAASGHRVGRKVRHVQAGVIRDDRRQTAQQHAAGGRRPQASASGFRASAATVCAACGCSERR